MAHKEYFAYDKAEIPEDIKNMTMEELDKEIERLERMHRQEKLALQQQDTSKKIAV